MFSVTRSLIERDTNEYFRHYKDGKVYRLLHFGKNADTVEDEIVYQQALDQVVYTRPAIEFYERLDYPGPMRFTRMEGKDKLRAMWHWWLMTLVYRYSQPKRRY